MLFTDRADAGRQLAFDLLGYQNHPDLLILALPRGGVPIAREVALALQAPMHVFVVRKLGVPGHEEVAMGAIATGGIMVTNEDVIHSCQIPRNTVTDTAAEAFKELQRQNQLYNTGRSLPAIKGKTIIVVDDGLATGSTMRAAIKALKMLSPARIIAAAPVGSATTCAELATEADEVICTRKPEPLYAVGNWYQNFAPTTDQEVRALLSDTDACALENQATLEA